MKKYIKIHPWQIVEDAFVPENNLNSESVFSIGNGKMGQRANFEEDYSGESLQGSYVAGVYYTDKTLVGWWKNGYPDYFAKVLNSVNWIGLHIHINGQILDLHQCKITDFKRVLDMKRGVLERKFIAVLPNGDKVEVKSIRFYSMENDEQAVLQYVIKALNFEGQISIESYLDFNVRNEDSNYDENFWLPVNQNIDANYGQLTSKTKKTNFAVCCGMANRLWKENALIGDKTVLEQSQKISHKYEVEIKEGESLRLEKYISISSSFYYNEVDLEEQCQINVAAALLTGFDKMLKGQIQSWAENWAHNDITIHGDDAAQQAMRFNIFQLNQTYTGQDERLNIGPKGFTGEKYGGSTYWDTEAYCLPYYMSTAPQKVAKNLLLYRYKHLQKAIENAQKLGFDNGAALFPMVTMNGEECHNEWEITFEEIHRNGAIAYAIYDYVRYTDDQGYLVDYGLEVLIAIARFWAQRVHFSQAKKQYVMHGVTGPNEYENNANNNWYTSYIARWCLSYTLDIIKKTEGKTTTLFSRINFDKANETANWRKIIDLLYLPRDEERGIYLQQDGFLDKDLTTVADLDPRHLPLVHNWSWDRILRSCYIKQADVLQGFYFFEDHFSKDELARNFDFYEPLTVHESSLSPCVHSILAAALGREEKAYEMFMRTARLDLDDFNSDSKDGCHITSMAGTWLAFVKGFGGMRVKDGELLIAPFLPEKWEAYSFTIGFKNTKFTISVNKKGVEISVDKDIDIMLFNDKQILKKGVNIFAKTPTLANSK